jgi:hypothetical protein
MEISDDTTSAFMHFTKVGSIWHIRDGNGNWTRNRRAPSDADTH